MFRPLLTTSLIALSAAAQAETFTAQATVDRVTIYPGVAEVTRQITLDLPAGQHQVIVPDLPQNMPREGLRVSAPAGTVLGAVNLAYDRLPVTPDASTPEVEAARAEVERLEAVLRDRDADIARIRLRVAAAEEQVAFLRSLSQSQGAEATGTMAIADIQALAQMVGAEVLSAREAALTAEQEAQAAERARADDQEALDDAKQALAALLAPDSEGAVLTFTLAAAEAGQVTVNIGTLEGYAMWTPVYDMRLTTGDAPTMDIDRAVVISQETGQDWTDVELVLSTARPGERIAPGEVYPELRRIISEDDLVRPQVMVEESFDARGMGGLAMNEAMPAPVPMAVKATADFSGATVSYIYPSRVTIRNGVEDLRLPLDSLSFDATVWAEAVPSRDSIGYRMAEFTNDTGEVLLPGQALLYADGTMIGFSQLDLLAAGADTALGFGPLDGLRLTRATPNRTEGDRGVFTTTNQLTEEAVMTVENLTGQAWDVILRDAVPYTEQEDLELDLTASPAITRRDPDGRRGVLEWDLSLAAGEKAEVRMNYTLSWPDGYVLR